MAPRPLILALANPTPEIFPELAHATRDDVVIATSRSDYPNQVNNVLCFPYIFRGALDVGATTITREMEIAAVHAIAGLAEEEQNEVVAAAYGAYDVAFGAQYLIPKPFDPPDRPYRAGRGQGGDGRRRGEAPADRSRRVRRATAAIRLPLRCIHEAAVRDGARLVRDGGKARIVFTEGEDERVLRAVQVIVDEAGAADPGRAP